MPGLSRKEIAQLVPHLEAQGVSTTRTKSGILLRMPDKEHTAMIHFTSSDVNAPKKLRADLKRWGVTWPTDDPGKLPGYITRGKPTNRSIMVLQAALDALPDDGAAKVHVRDLKPGTGWQDDRIANGLYHLGYLPSSSRKGFQRYWLRPAHLSPDLPAPEEVAPVTALRAAEAVTQPQAWVTPDLSLVPPQPPTAPAAATSPEAPAAPAPGGPREFLDSVDSWTLAWEEFPPGMSLAKLRQVLGAAGLEVELRAWRAAR